jgi:hypothetical protein
MLHWFILVSVVMALINLPLIGVGFLIFAFFISFAKCMGDLRHVIFGRRRKNEKV